jgi:hypothetical protein
MRRFEGHQQGETKRDEAVFTESAAVKVTQVSLRQSTPSRHNRAIVTFRQGEIILAIVYGAKVSGLGRHLISMQRWIRQRSKSADSRTAACASPFIFDP